jgi:hypothetical protein
MDQRQHLPAYHVKDVFAFYYRKNAAVILARNFPNGLIGKIYPLVKVKFGIIHILRLIIASTEKKLNPSSKSYICVVRRVEISMGTKRSGVIGNFTIFYGDELLQRIKFYTADERKGIPNGTQ